MPTRIDANTQITNLPSVNTSKFDFPAQTPGGSLTAGITNTITLSPVPEGVNGSDSNHYLYISGGTGTAEAVLITGGSATSGAESGTITFTPTYSHSGAWTIRSASGGIAEAAIYLVGAGTGGIINVDENITVYQKIQVPTTGQTIGITIQGNGATRVISRDSSYPIGDLFYFTSSPSAWPAITIRDLDIESAPFNAQFVSAGGAAIHFKDYGFIPARVDNVRIMNAYQGILIEGSQFITVSGGYIGWHTPVIDATTPRAGIEVKKSLSHLPSGINIKGTVIFGGYSDSRPNVEAGIIISSSDELTISDVWMTQLNRGLYVQGDAYFVQATNLNLDYMEQPVVIDGSTGSLIGPITISDSWIGACAASASPGVTTNMVAAVDINASSGLLKFTLADNIIMTGGIYGVKVVGGNVSGGTITGNLITGNNSRNSAFGAGIAIGQGASNLAITGNVIRDYGLAAGYQNYGVYIADAGSSNLNISNNNLSGNLIAPFSFAFVPTGSVRGGNTGVDDVMTTTIASAATISVSDGYSFYKITGTTPLATINDGWTGQTITCQFTDAAPGGVTTGGNIYTAKSAAQNATITLRKTATNWVVL